MAASGKGIGLTRRAAAPCLRCGLTERAAMKKSSPRDQRNRIPGSPNDGTDCPRSWIRSRRGCRAEAGHHSYDCLRIDRFDDVAVEPGLARAAPVLLLPPACQCHQGDRASPGLFPNPAGDIVAVEDRHAEIEKCNVRPEGGG